MKRRSDFLAQQLPLRLSEAKHSLGPAETPVRHFAPENVDNSDQADLLHMRIDLGERRISI